MAVHTHPEMAILVRLSIELACQLEADKHRDQPELLEVQVLNLAEKIAREFGMDWPDED